MSRKRIRAHANPLADDIPFPLAPSAVDWAEYFGDASVAVTTADIGCGFGGLLIALAETFPNERAVGLEIRERVVQVDQSRIAALRMTSPGRYDHIAILRANVMKSAVRYFQCAQLRRAFVLFADPHFKHSNHRRRVISSGQLDYLAYIMADDARLYTITDVAALYEWTVAHCTAHPLFVRINEEEADDDDARAINIIKDRTEEGAKVSRQFGNKFVAVFRRRPRSAAASSS